MQSIYLANRISDALEVRDASALKELKNDVCAIFSNEDVERAWIDLIDANIGFVGLMEQFHPTDR